MNLSMHEFQFGLFGKKVQMFREGEMGIVVEKEPQVVCIYGTDGTNSNILCAVPLCHPKFLKGLTYQVIFREDRTALVSGGDIKVCIDFAARRCANNKGLPCYGSDAWGQDVSADWNDACGG